MEERMEFIMRWREDEEGVAALCRYFGISRETGYKWLRRYEADGMEGLQDHSRVPHHSPRAVSEAIEEAIIRARAAHSHGGPKKLVAWLSRQDRQIVWPAPSTVGNILHRRGLAIPRRRSRRSPVYG